MKSALEPAEVYDSCITVAHHYSRGLLTKDDDKPVAIAGIAEKYGETFGKVLGPYCSGLWQNFLIEGLRWTKTNSLVFGRRPKPRATTWSWMAIDGAILLPAPRKDQLFAEAVACVFSLRSGMFSYGAVTPGAFVILEGPVIEVTMVVERSSRLEFEYDLRVHNSTSESQDQGRECVGVGTLDPDGWPDNITFHCLGLPKRYSDDGAQDQNTVKCGGILLMLDPESDFYVRAGWFNGFSNFCERAELKKVVII